ncbi:MAG TPA: hypothetical protein VFW94_07405 [Candidatus Acidoferrales bacterium]|nr:hypothetical protein [Candidatus Acidoferrales bacterium]
MTTFHSVHIPNEEPSHTEADDWLEAQVHQVEELGYERYRRQQIRAKE